MIILDDINCPHIAVDYATALLAADQSYTVKDIQNIFYLEASLQENFSLYGEGTVAQVRLEKDMTVTIEIFESIESGGEWVGFTYKLSRSTKFKWDIVS